MRYLLILILAGFCQASTLSVANDSPLQVTGVFFYNQTSFQNSLQWPIPPGQQTTVIHRYTHGTFGVFIDGPLGHVDWIDLDFHGGDYVFHYNPPWSTFEVKYHHDYGTGCEARETTSWSFVFLSALWLARRRYRHFSTMKVRAG